MAEPVASAASWEEGCGKCGLMRRPVETHTHALLSWANLIQPVIHNAQGCVSVCYLDCQNPLQFYWHGRGCHIWSKLLVTLTVLLLCFPIKNRCVTLHLWPLWSLHCSWFFFSLEGVHLPSHTWHVFMCSIFNMGLTQSVVQIFDPLSPI